MNVMMDVLKKAAAPDQVSRQPARAVFWAQVVAAVLAVVAVVLTSNLDHWQIWPLIVISLFAIASDLTAVSTGPMLRVSGSFLGIVLAAVLLGGGPAAVVGVLTIAVGWIRWRESPHYLVNNLANYAWFPLLAGLLFHLGITAAHVDSHQLAYYLMVFATFLIALGLNFVVCAGYQCYLEASSLRKKAGEALVPLLSADLFSALLTLAAVYVAKRLGTTGIALFGLVLVVFQYLIGELLTSKRRSEQLQRVATTDELTGLANRERFREVVEERLAAARREGSTLSVLLMDLDRFKEINDTLGHHYGDVLLRDLGPRLVAAIGNGGLVARLGGDEFGILLPYDTDDLGVLDRVIDRLFTCVSEPFAVDELSLEVGASVGVARFPHDGEDSHALLRCADIAMYAAKESQTDYKIYTAEQNQHSIRRLSVLSDIRHALVSDQIVVHFQPIIDLDDLRVRGAEGLVRWQHPELGLIPPGAFVNTIEQTGLIGPLTRHVLERSIAECAAWRRDGRELSVAVNLSVRNLLDRDLPKEIERILAAYSLPADALQLEITESMIMSDPDRAVATVSRLSALGVRMSVDDFGTGYSSLANLRRLPIDELKIDRSFVSPMLRDESDLIIVRSTINLGHDLGLRIIAEGVEDGPTLDRLALLGCDLAQGYHVSRPMPADAFNVWLDESSPVGPPALTPQHGAPGQLLLPRGASLAVDAVDRAPGVMVTADEAR
jgi:diguanylate cyclase (GGDEF)-like protein